MVLMSIQLVTSLEECKKVATSSGIPCLLISSWRHNNDCSTYSVKIYKEDMSLLDTRTLGTYSPLEYCNVTFNYTDIGTYMINYSDGDTAIIIVEEDNNMLIALVIGVSLIVGLFIFLTFAVKDDKPFLANFFFLGIFIFTTILSNLLWKITNMNSSPYEPIMLLIYRMFLIITMLMVFIVLLILTIEVIKVRKIAGNPIDNYRDNLGKNE